jgi:hypothetical protein
MNPKKFEVKAETTPSAARVAPTPQMPSLADIAATTDTTYTAARYAPRDYEDLKAQAIDAYDSGTLRKEYYPKKSRKVFRGTSKQYDLVDIVYTPEELAKHRRRGILTAVQVARRGATLNMLPEVAWATIYPVDGNMLIGCHAMKGAILTLRTCLEWTDMPVTELREGRTYVIGYKMVVRRLLPSGCEQRTEVEVYASEFLHLQKDGVEEKDTWWKYFVDMLYAACVRRAAQHSNPDRLLGMSTKEEFVFERRARQEGTKREEAPTIDSILDDMLEAEEPAMVAEAAPVQPPQEPSVEPVAPAAKPGPTKEQREAEYKALMALLPQMGDTVTPDEIAKLLARVAAFADMPLAHKRLLDLWHANGCLNPAVEVS